MANLQPNFYGVGSFAAPVDMHEVMSSAIEIGRDMSATTYGPDAAGGGQLVSLWLSSAEPMFVSVSARPFLDGGAWVRCGAQGVGNNIFATTDEISTELRARVGVTLGALPPERDAIYDRGETGQIEGEMQGLLLELAEHPGSSPSLSPRVYALELRLQHLTDLGC